MVSIARSIPSFTSNRPEATHYHVLLNSVTQLRFAYLVKMTFLWCWAIGGLLSLRRSTLLAIVPLLGAVLCAAILPIYIFRRGRMYPRVRPHASLFLEAYHKLISKSMLRGSIIYLFSSSIVTEVYCYQFSDLSYFLPKLEFELARLNEKRLYINSFSFFLAIVYAAIHVITNKDQVSLPRVKTNPMTRLKSSIQPVLLESAKQSAASSLVFVLVYAIVRPRVWHTSVYFARIVKKLYRSSAYGGSFPFTPIHSLALAFTLFFIWNMANRLFLIYVTIGALYRGKGISEKSSDRNSTLISGLKSSKRAFTRRVAFQELNYIAHNNSTRRVTIFQDIAQPSAWQQIMVECLSLLVDLQTKFNLKPDHLKTAAATATTAATTATKGASTTALPVPVSGSPAPAPMKVRKENIFLTPAGNKTSPGRKLIEGLQDHNAEQSAKTIKQIEQIQSTYSQLFDYVQTKYALEFLRTRFGLPFRCTIQRQVAYLLADQDQISEGVSALTELVRYSLTEDTYGTVQRDIPRVLSELDKTITLLDEYLRSPPLHWSDVTNRTKLVKGVNPVGIGGIELDELEIVVDNLTEGFDLIARTFEKYLTNMSLTPEVYKRCGISIRANR
ncbi:nucleoporin protein Ndc1-Nup [Lipomyces japonicus]|uniref:nucleoporin protein Ndc1-Nup n=1 Tax=Lipomyces japonicus TaxID=56871 RepID=UPI0034CF2755